MYKLLFISKLLFTFKSLNHINHYLKFPYFFSYLYLRNDTPYSKQEWNTTLQKYIQEGHIPEDISTLIQHVLPIKILNLQDQLYFLSNISNYHWWKFIRCDGNKSKSGIHVRLTDHLLYHPISEQSSTRKVGIKS